MRVEHNVVGAAQLASVAFGVQIFQLACFHIKPLNTTTGVIGFIECSGKREPQKVDLAKRAAVVANVQTAIWAERNAVWAARHIGNLFLCAVGLYSRDALAKHLHQNHAAIRHCNWSFWETESGCDFSKFGHSETLRHLFVAPKGAAAN